MSTEPRFESLRQALLAMRGGALPSSMAGLSPLTPGTPKKTPWQLEQEERARSSTSASAPLLEAAVLGRRQRHGAGPTAAAALRYWRRAAQGSYGALAAAVGASTRGGGGGDNSTNVATAAAASPPIAPPPLLRLPPPLAHALPQEIDVSFVPLFHALSPETLLQALTAVLLERPVVVQSASRTLTTLACEALRRLLHPFTWLRPFMPLLPVAGICAFWDETRRAGGGQSWFDYVFEDDGLDDSLVAAAGEAYVVRACVRACGRGYTVGRSSHDIHSTEPHSSTSFLPFTPGTRHHCRGFPTCRPRFPRGLGGVHRRCRPLRPKSHLPRVQREQLPRLGLFRHLRGLFCL